MGTSENPVRKRLIDN